jgi:hypothetical protein
MMRPISVFLGAAVVSVEEARVLGLGLGLARLRVDVVDTAPEGCLVLFLPALLEDGMHCADVVSLVASAGASSLWLPCADLPCEAVSLLPPAEVG